MSIVQPWIPDARVLDLFAGSGALGLEALSRGARVADFVELRAPSLRLLTENISALEAGAAAVVHRGDAIRFTRALEAGAYDVAFADPPYDSGFGPEIATCWLGCPFASILGIEHDAREAMPAGGETRHYGSTAITFYQDTNE